VVFVTVGRLFVVTVMAGGTGVGTPEIKCGRQTVSRNGYG